MSPLPTPLAVHALNVAVSRAALWAQLRHSRFIAAYLGITLPPAWLRAGRVLHGTDAQGQALQLRVDDARAGHHLSLRIERPGAGPLRLLLSLDEQAAGTRLLLQHEGADAPDERPDPGLDDAVLRTLLAPLPPSLRGERVAGAEALKDAIDWLAQSAEAVVQLRAALPHAAGRWQPATGAFSLVEHLWHLADIEALGWLPRLQRLHRERRPQLPGVDGDRLAREQRYQARPWPGAARRFVALRRRSLAELRRFDAASLALPLVFAGRAMDLGGLLAAMLAHDQEHRHDMAACWRQERPRSNLREPRR